MGRRKQFSGIGTRPSRLAMAAIMIVLAALAEASLRILELGYGHTPINPDADLGFAHPKDFHYRIYSRHGEYGGYAVHYGSDGARVMNRFSEAAPRPDTTSCRIAFLGDSFTEALQVRFEKSYVGRIGQASGCAFRNYGVGSYSPIHYLIQWGSIAQSFQPTLVVLQLFADDEASDTTLMEQAVKSADGLPLRIGSAERWPLLWLREIYLVRLFRMTYNRVLWTVADQRAALADERPSHGLAPDETDNPEVSDVTSRLVSALAERVNKSGARLILLAIPAERTLREARSSVPFAKKWRAWATQRDIQFIDVASALAAILKSGKTPFYAANGHFNEMGHAVIADALCRGLASEADLSLDCLKANSAAQF